MVRGALIVGVLAIAGVRTPAQSVDLPVVLTGLAERTQQYYDRFISIICTETVHQQDLRFNLTARGKPRVMEFELSVTRDSRSPDQNDFRVERIPTMVNGRPPRKDHEPGCTDPKTGTPEPLEFLLANNQKGYRFRDADAAGGPDGSRAVDFVESHPERVQITWRRNCFEADGGGHEGRIWFDPVTYDIRRIDVRLSKPFLVPLPAGYLGVQPAIRVERSEMTVRFARVNFSNPDETVLLPESIESLTVFRGAPSLRTTQKLSNFRRFLSESSIRTTGF
jgi:hypothetical protein